jgi:hypothetical protein
MLFKKQNGHSRRNTRKVQRRRITVIEEPRSLPEFMCRLDVLCKDRSHALPCRMKFIGKATSDKGNQVVMYACPLCNSRQGWCLGHQTNKPRVLFSKPAPRRH